MQLVLVRLAGPQRGRQLDHELMPVAIRDRPPDQAAAAQHLGAKAHWPMVWTGGHVMRGPYVPQPVARGDDPPSFVRLGGRGVQPQDRAELVQVPAVRRWRARAATPQFGGDFLGQQLFGGGDPAQHRALVAIRPFGEPGDAVAEQRQMLGLLPQAQAHERGHPQIVRQRHGPGGELSSQRLPEIGEIGARAASELAQMGAYSLV